MASILFCSDLHCGHETGLTPPDWRATSRALAKAQAALWDFWTGVCSRRYDYLVCAGDAITGKELRSGGREAEADRLIQTDMATACLQRVKAKKRFIVAGTPYHTGDGEDFEAIVARRIGATFKSQLFLDAGGVTFDVRHHVGGVSVPRGVPASLPRASLQNYMWHVEGVQPIARVTVRGHLHRFMHVGDDHWTGFVLPCLHLPGGIYGSRRVDSTISVGVVVITAKDGGFSWERVRFDLGCRAAQLYR